MLPKKKSLIAKSLIFYAAFLSILPLALSLGVSPGRTILEPVPGETKEMGLLFINAGNTQKEIEVSLRDGPFKDYITIEERKLILPAEGTARVPFTFTQPKEFVGYGRVCNGISAKELAEPHSQGIVAVVEVVYSLCVEYPYPGKYLETRITATPVNEGTESTYALIQTKSKGTEEINFLRGNMVLKDSEENALEEYEIPIFDSLLPGTQETKSVEIKTKELKGGNYILEAYLNYDGIRTQENTTLVIGYPDIDIIRHTKAIQTDSSENFELVIKNNFLSEFKIVFFDLQIGDDPRFSFRSPPADLKKLEVKSINLLISTKNLALGEYPARLTVFFGDYKKTVETKITVTEKTARDLPGKIESGSILPLIILTVLSNVLIILLIILLLKRKDIDEEKI
ncbi:MAG TPA: hypothetical protein ENN46_04480 [Candidatus Woesearchaeota archaeon]|nr:hypothetical protein [Candidatus Woesearchaeota archaeon]